MILALTGKFFVAVTLTAGNQLTFEMIPTVLRAQGGAMATSLGMALSFCAPYIAYSVSRIHSLRLIRACLKLADSRKLALISLKRRISIFNTI